MWKALGALLALVMVFAVCAVVNIAIVLFTPWHWGMGWFAKARRKGNPVIYNP
jgi:hypothetical protein